MFEFLKQWWQGDSLSEDEYVRRRAQLLGKAPIPTFWLLGKTGSGKSSIIRYLTGVESAEIGNGYRPQTKTSQRYDFPDSKDPLMTFLDTRGLGEAGYDPTEDLESFSDSTQLVLVTVRVLDHALDELIASLKTIRAAAPERPILLALTCLHETVPGSDISERDLFTSEVPVPGELPDDLKRSLQHQIELFAGLADAVVPIDLTQPAEGFAHPNFGGDRLKAAILELLPSSYRQTLLHLEELVSPLKSLQQRRAQSAILSASTIAGTAAAVPLPWVDIPVVFAIQTHLAYRLAAIYELELTTAQWAQLTGVAGGRIAVGMAVREMLKVIPWVGMAANAAAAFAYTFATGMAWNWYFLEVKQGHVPSADELQKVFQEQLSRGAALWKETDQQPASSEGGAFVKFRQLVIIALLVLPVFVYLAFGIYAVGNWLADLDWLDAPRYLDCHVGIVACLEGHPSSSPAAAASPIEVPGHWTQQDEAGLKIVARHQELVSEVTAEDLIDPHHYLNAALSLAGDLAKHFNRSQEHPVDGVTATEALAAMRLALDDTERWVIANVPGSQLVTIGQWKMLARASKWVEPATKAGWLASSIFNPVNAVNYFISKATLGPVISDVQRELLATVFVRYIRQVGFYLIEMYSGRLKGGADVYRNTFGRKSAAADPTEGSHQELELKSLQIALLGQVKAGKSSLINALLEQQQATTDVLPQTRSVSRYSWTLPGTEEQLTLLDTPGYAEAGATSAQVSEIETAVAEADVVLLVLAANSPARSADVELLKQLQAHYAGRQHLKLPPVIGVLTHIDLLSPVREWNPPYDWRSGQSPKVESIRGAVGYAQEVFGNAVADVVPVCTSDDTSRRTGVMNDLVPAIISQVEAGQSAALLKAYHDRLNSDRLKTFLGQLTSASGSMLRWWVEERFLPSINKGK